MRILFLLFLLFTASLPAGAQGLRVVNTKFYCNSQPTTFETVTDIIQTKDGGFFFTGKVHKPGGAFYRFVVALVQIRQWAS